MPTINFYLNPEGLLLPCVLGLNISFTIFDPSGICPDTITRPDWLVTNLPQDLPDLDVLFGMDLISDLLLTINGPAKIFTLEF